MMDIGAIVSVLGTASSLTGYALKDLLNLLKKSEQKQAVAINVASLLAQLDIQDDDFSGLWTLSDWDYTYETHRGWSVAGYLAIVPSRNKWNGYMWLAYQKVVGLVRLWTPSSWIEQKLGRYIEGGYRVEFYTTGQRIWKGTSTMTYRLPPGGPVDTGEFDNIQTAPTGKLLGEFRNTNAPGSSKFTFHQRRRWQEVGSMFSS